MVVNDPDTNDSMVNYESLVIQADKALTAKNKEPLLAVYPSDGIAISDSPLAYVDRRQDKEDAFKRFSKSINVERIPRNCSNRRVVEPVRTARWRMPKMRR